jgi:hypothetical protein
MQAWKDARSAILVQQAHSAPPAPVGQRFPDERVVTLAEAANLPEYLPVIVDSSKGEAGTVYLRFRHLITERMRKLTNVAAVFVDRIPNELVPLARAGEGHMRSRDVLRRVHMDVPAEVDKPMLYMLGYSDSRGGWIRLDSLIKNYTWERLTGATAAAPAVVPAPGPAAPGPAAPGPAAPPGLTTPRTVLSEPRVAPLTIPAAPGAGGPTPPRPGEAGPSGLRARYAQYASSHSDNDSGDDVEIMQCCVCTQSVSTPTLAARFTCGGYMCLGDDGCLKTAAINAKNRNAPLMCYHDGGKGHVAELSAEVLSALKKVKLDGAAMQTLTLAYQRESGGEDRFSPKCPGCSMRCSVQLNAKRFYCLQPGCSAPAYGYCVECHMPVVKGKEAHDCGKEATRDEMMAILDEDFLVIAPCPNAGCSYQGHAATKAPEDCNHITCDRCGTKYCGACQHIFTNRNGSYEYAHPNCPARNMFRNDRDVRRDILRQYGVGAASEGSKRAKH